MSLTHARAGEMLATARHPSDGKPLGNNTRLHRLADGSYAVRLHATDIVIIHEDDTYTLNTGGWSTPVTRDRICQWSPARLTTGTDSYHTRPVWVVSQAGDPRTPVKVRSCRACKGTGVKHTRAYTQTHGVRDVPTYEQITKPSFDDHYHIIGWSHPVIRHDAGAWVRLPEPIVHPSEPYPCYLCGGTGKRDYGSRTCAVIFYDGITVDRDGETIEGGDRLWSGVTTGLETQSGYRLRGYYR